MINIVGDDYKLLVVIVNKKEARNVVLACKEAGAEGDTVLAGRGTGTHDPDSIFGVKVEPEKEIILSIVHNNMINEVLDAATEAANLNKPGTGIAFTLDSKSICGIAHHLQSTSDK